MISVTRKIHIPSVEISFCCAGVSNCSRSARASVWLSNFGLLHRGQRCVIVSLRRGYRGFGGNFGGGGGSRVALAPRAAGRALSSGPPAGGGGFLGKRGGGGGRTLPPFAAGPNLREPPNSHDG